MKAKSYVPRSKVKDDGPMLHDWTKYEPEIIIQTVNFVLVKPPSTNEGRDTLNLLERMRTLGYRFVVEGFAGLIFEKPEERKI